MTACPDCGQTLTECPNCYEWLHPDQIEYSDEFELENCKRCGEVL